MMLLRFVFCVRDDVIVVLEIGEMLLLKVVLLSMVFSSIVGL